jgi:glycosyltransferase involved in cell wall biosynthesis
LHLAGDGPQRTTLQRQIDATKLPSSRLRLLGRSSEPWTLMREADAFVMASRYEGFPNALLEAMGTGLPCVATDCPSGPREISRDGIDALLVTPGDSVALEAALDRLMGDATLRKDLGERARKSVMERYSLPTVLKIWDAVFASVGVMR